MKKWITILAAVLLLACPVTALTTEPAPAAVPERHGVPVYGICQSSRNYYEITLGVHGLDTVVLPDGVTIRGNGPTQPEGSVTLTITAENSGDKTLFYMDGNAQTRRLTSTAAVGGLSFRMEQTGYYLLEKTEVHRRPSHSGGTGTPDKTGTSQTTESPETGDTTPLLLYQLALAPAGWRWQRRCAAAERQSAETTEKPHGLCRAALCLCQSCSAAARSVSMGRARSNSTPYQAAAGSVRVTWMHRRVKSAARRKASCRGMPRTMPATAVAEKMSPVP